MNKSSNKILSAIIATILTFIICIVEFRKISTMMKNETACGGDGILLTDSSTGRSTYVNMTTYVDEKVAVNEIATTSYGVNYSKEGNMSLLDVDCDVKEAFEILDCVRMRVEIKIGDIVYHQAYVKSSDGFTYLVETDEFGNILRNSEGNANILKRCNFADLYLGEE